MATEDKELGDPRAGFTAQQINTVPSKKANRIDAGCCRSLSRSESHGAHGWRLHVDLAEHNNVHPFGRLNDTLLNFTPALLPEPPKAPYTRLQQQRNTQLKR